MHLGTVVPRISKSGNSIRELVHRDNQDGHGWRSEAMCIPECC